MSMNNEHIIENINQNKNKSFDNSLLYRKKESDEYLNDNFIHKAYSEEKLFYKNNKNYISQKEININNIHMLGKSSEKDRESYKDKDEEKVKLKDKGKDDEIPTIF